MRQVAILASILLAIGVAGCGGSSKPEVTVPDVIGVPVLKASERLRATGFEVETSASPGDLTTPSEDPCFGTTVSEQIPGPGETAEEGSTVKLRADCL